MKKLLQAALLFLPAVGFTQAVVKPQQKKCATYEVMQNMRRLYPNLETDQQFETWLTQKKALRTHNTQAVVTLPVVFHVIHSGEAEGSGTNISQALLQQQILQLNKDFGNASNSPYAVSANTNVQFALAQTDPSGNMLAQPGIDRILYTTRGFTAPPYTVGFANASNNYLTNTIKPATIWDPTRYLNVWVLQMEAGILGIATFPSSSGLPGIAGGDNANTAGVSVGPETIGSIFSPSSCGGSYTKGKTLTHEMGHFFGLRHIWGDAPCGNDYCNDTPVHADDNAGVPTHPKANSCGTADEMFENYMDYSDDVILNTFTADQVARIQTVLTNSPRRNTLASSTVGLVPVTATNRVAFYDCAGVLSISEPGLTGSSPRYRDYVFTLNVEDKATGNATVTINTGGTAVNGADYQVLTPTLNFVAGDGFKPVTIRVFDDALVESSKTINLSFSISGTGVTAGTSAQTMAITLADDDNVTVSNNTVTVLSQDFSAASGWSVLTGGGSNQFIIGSGGNAGGTGNSAYVSNNGFSNMYSPTDPSLSVMQSPLINAVGLSNLQLTFKYRVWGEQDAGGVYDYGELVQSPASNRFSVSPVNAPGAGPYVGTTGVVSGNPTISLPNSDFANKQFYLGFYWENDNSIGNDPALNIDDVVLTATGTQVETAVSNSYGFNIQAGAGINNLRSTGGKMIARLTNLSEDVPAVTASVTAAGNGQVAIASNNGSFLRTQKVIQLTPSTANTTASYQVTLFYTSAELAAWGTGKLQLKVLKVRDGVSLSSQMNSTNAVVITPVSATEDAAAGVIQYVVNVTGGFSQFVLVSSNFILPVNLLTFEAQPAKRSIELSWKTSQERNNNGFHIERSTNGTDFTSIGWVKGAGTTNNVSSYRYTDNFVQPNMVYYYRLNQVDVDSRSQLSNIRQAKISESRVVVTLSPNPSRDQAKLFVSGVAKPVNVSLLNAKGQTVARWSQVNLATPYTLNVSRFAKGHYTLVIHLEEGDKTEQLIIQ